MMPITILLSDTNEIFRKGLSRLLRDQPQISVVYECDNTSAMIQRAWEILPDLVLMEPCVPLDNSVKALEHLNEALPKTKLAVLTDCQDESWMFSALRAGASGYLLKNIGLERLLKSIELITHGELVVSPPLSEQLLSEVASSVKDQPSSRVETVQDLSERETEVLKLVATGATNEEIANELVIAENTVKVHIKHILEKRNLRNKQQAAAYAVQTGLVTNIERQHQ